MAAGAGAPSVIKGKVVGVRDEYDAEVVGLIAKLVVNVQTDKDEDLELDVYNRAGTEGIGLHPSTSLRLEQSIFETISSLKDVLRSSRADFFFFFVKGRQILGLCTV